MAEASLSHVNATTRMACYIEDQGQRLTQNFPSGFGIFARRFHLAHLPQREVAAAQIYIKRIGTMTDTERDQWDVIVIGSGMGGMAAAAALSRVGKKVLMLEQHRTLGGLTHSFSRDGFTWDVGVHYLSEMAPEDRSAPPSELALRHADRLRAAGICI